MSHQSRINALQDLLSGFRLDGFLVTKLSNIRYLTGFSGTNGICLITNSDAIFTSDSRYEQQASQEVSAASIHIGKGFLPEKLKELACLPDGENIGFEADSLPYGQFRKLKDLLPGVRWQPQEKLVEQLSISKSEEEIGSIQLAAEFTDKIFLQLIELIRPGTRECDIAAEILYRFKKMGADNSAFEPIVASGHRSALPHGVASEKEIEEGDLVILDFGCVVNGYASDLTRTVVVGKASDEQRRIYEVVRTAQQSAIQVIRAGISCSELDATARNVIREAGYGEYFGHALGHGLGLEVHGEPRIAAETDSSLPENAVITIEPGIYVPDLGGVRIEDDVVVRVDHAELLTHSSRDLIEIS